MRWDKILFTVATRPQLLVPVHVRNVPRFQHAEISSYVAKHHSCHNPYSSIHKRILASNFASECDHLLQFTHITTRGYAKGKDRGRDKKKTEKGKSFVYENENFQDLL